MKNTAFILLLVFSFIFGACKDDSNSASDSTKEALMSANGWKMDRFATLDGTTVTSNKLPPTTALILTLDFAFLQIDASKGLGIVRATDKISKQVVNSGTWAFAENQTKIDINVVGFKGLFPLVELSKTKMVLRNSVLISGVATDVNMEFSPNL